ncbi:Gp15 family bacteriophage protein [Bacillus sp. J33]|uniref:Gp15 family bacteriophage protein n=1 Tax=Bacillus sp. J33 TaxID=935836 RepID=UPI0004789759|nr:Gp15 family bacteriophage protein [Bacillus sp. J33]
MKLTERFTDEIEYKGQTIKLNLAFDNVLRVRELLQDDVFSGAEKLLILFEMLVKNANGLNFSFNEINQLIGFIFDEILFPKKGSDGRSHFDFDQDAAFIYASFLQDYKMDLFEMQGKLHWEKFLALLEGLSDDTKFKEVVSIRAQKIPAPTKYNQEERKRLIELKRIYRLKNKKPSLEEADAVLMSISKALKKSYKKGR